MVLGTVRTALRGSLAWLGGTLAVLVMGFAGVASGGGLGGAASTFIDANAVPLDGGAAPVWLVLVPAAMLALAGLRTGRSTTGGLVGRLREVASNLSSTGGSPSRRAAVAGAQLAAAYALTGALAAAAVGRSVGSDLVSGGVLGLVVAVPAAVFAARR